MISLVRVVALFICLSSVVSADNADASTYRIYNIVALGNSGVGKSSLLNMLAGDEEAFNVGHTASSVTEFTESRVFRFMNESDGIRVRLVDTQGLSDSGGDQTEMNNLRNMVEHIRGLGRVDLFLICLDGLNPRFTTYTHATVDLLRSIFPDFLKHAVLVFNKWTLPLERTFKLRQEYQAMFRAAYNTSTDIPCYFIDSNFNRAMLRFNDDGEERVCYLHPRQQAKTRAQLIGLKNFLALKNSYCVVSDIEAKETERVRMLAEIEAAKRQAAMKQLEFEHAKEDALYADDIRYFSEANMRKDYIREFYYDYLPGHLQRIFRPLYPTKVDASHRMLQDYRRRTQHGMTSVSFWYAVDERFHAIPIFGSIAVAIVRNEEDTTWKTLHFDSQLGKCLGADRNDAAVELNKRGNLYYQAERYDKALDYYKNAMENTSDNDKNVAVYLANQAYALIGLKKLDEAQHAAEVALQFDETYVEAKKILEMLKKSRS